MDATNRSRGSSSLTISERLCVVFLPFVGLIEALVLGFGGCFEMNFRRSPLKPRSGFDDIVYLAKNSPFSINEVEALLDLYQKLSCSIIDDGLIHKEELQLALKKTPMGAKNLFLDRVFDLFDEKQNGVIEFDEFVHALSIFHPSASMSAKIDFTFRLYDLRQTGYIEREEVQEMVVASLLESGFCLSEESLEAIIDNTFAEADADKDGRISKGEWRIFVKKNPALLRNMTLPDLKDITTAFPSFIYKTELED